MANLPGPNEIGTCTANPKKTCVIDKSCLQGGPGCNAGGQGAYYRFCGFGDYAECPARAVSNAVNDQGNIVLQPGQCVYPVAMSQGNPPTLVGKYKPHSWPEKDYYVCNGRMETHGDTVCCRGDA